MEKEIKDIVFCIDSEQRSIYSVIRQLEYMSDQLAKAKETASNLVRPGHRLQLDALLVREVAARLATTGNLKDACNYVAENTGLSSECVYFAFIHAKNIRKVLDRYALSFACVRLKKAGLKAKAISELLGISETYFYKLEKLYKDLPEKIPGKVFLRRKI